MKHSLMLFPHAWKRVGWSIFIPMLLSGLFVVANSYELPMLTAKVPALIPEPAFLTKSASGLIPVNLTNTIVGVLFITGALLVGFSKERHEDEYIGELRLSALLWAVMINYILLIVAFLLVYSFSFLTVMTFNMFTVLLLFILRFHYLLYRSKVAAANEK